VLRFPIAKGGGVLIGVIIPRVQVSVDFGKVDLLLLGFIGDLERKRGEGVK
jgi:hypothetical protein